MFLYDDDEAAQVQFVGFVGEESRYDLMLVQTNRHFGKTIVLNMQTNKFGIIGTDDLAEEGYTSFEFLWRVKRPEFLALMFGGFF